MYEVSPYAALIAILFVLVAGLYLYYRKDDKGETVGLEEEEEEADSLEHWRDVAEISRPFSIDNPHDVRQLLFIKDLGEDVEDIQITVVPLVGDIKITFKGSTWSFEDQERVNNLLYSHCPAGVLLEVFFK